MKNIFKKYWQLIVILVVTGFLFIYRLGRDVLWEWDECLYGQYVKEMSKTGHYLTNIWNGYIDLQKPPLYSWLLQIPTLFGRSEFNLRILSVLAGLGALTAVYLFAQKYFSRRVAVLSSLILLCGELFVIYSMKMNTDILFTLFIFLGFWTWLESGKKASRSVFYVLSGIFFGAAVMVKGLGSLQFLAALFVALFLNFKKERFWDFVKMGVVFAAVIVPWHAAAYLVYGGRFFQIYIMENIIQRAKYPIEFHRERLWFYFTLIYRELFPWIFAIVIFPIIQFFNVIKTKNLKFKTLLAELKRNELIYTILILILVPLASITRVHTKIAWYALPIYPFLAIFLAYSIDLFINALSKKNKKLSLVLFMIFVILITLDALHLILNETRISESTQTLDPRYKVMFEVKKQPEKELNYLVAFGERQAKTILPPTEKIDMTFIYGGNPCAVYYSDKKVNYYYETAAFQQALKEKRGLFLIENGDSKYLDGNKTIYNNNEYTLFEKL